MIFSLFSVLYVSSVFSHSVLSKPLTPRQGSSFPTCTPSFSGDDPFDWNNSEPIGLSNGVNPGSRILKVPSLDRRLFKFTKVESFPPSFSIEPFGGFGLAVGLLANGTLALVKTEGAEKNTRFVIECGDCGSSLEDNCFMKLAHNTNACVQIGNGPLRGGVGDALFLTVPCKREDSQRFNFFRKTAPPPSLPPPSLPESTSVWPHEHVQGASTTTNHLPSPTPSKCNPNFEFEGVQVANSATSWAAPYFEADIDLVGGNDFNKRLEIRFEQTGSPHPVYVAKSVNGSNLVVATRASNDNLYFVNENENNERRFFKIECTAFCRGAGSVPPGDLSADGCNIISTFNNQCVQIGNGLDAGNLGDRIFLNTCDGSSSQRWNFVTSPFKQSGIPPPPNVAANAQVRLSSHGGVENSSELRELIRNSYIAIGLLAASLLGLIVFGVVAGRGCLRGRDLKPHYTVINGKGELESFTIKPDSGRYSD
ncbi:hypothetical protein ONZ45_g1462 [Pleurotus djamor]|nr:hypothetical protein ONZ45_g1462 [Pleurotus djamor]